MLPSVRVLGSTCTHDLSRQRAIDGVTGELFQARLTPSDDHLRSWLATLPGPVAVTYEAGPTGFGLYRSLTAAGIRCEVAAPSKLQRPAGDRASTGRNRTTTFLTKRSRRSSLAMFDRRGRIHITTQAALQRIPITSDEPTQKPSRSRRQEGRNPP